MHVAGEFQEKIAYLASLADQHGIFHNFLRDGTYELIWAARTIAYVDHRKTLTRFSSMSLQAEAVRCWGRAGLQLEFTNNLCHT